MHVHEAHDVKAGRLEQLDLADEDVLERVDAVARLLDLLGDGLGDELVNEALEVRLGRLCTRREEGGA